MSVLRALFYAVAAPALVLAALLARGKKTALIWGPVPIINNKYWALAMREAGWDAGTLMSEFYSTINRREDFDGYFGELSPSLPQGRLRRVLEPLIAHLHIARSAAVIHLPFSGGALGSTPIWWLEALLYRMAGVKTVLIPYGADIFRYSTVSDPAVRHALLLSYPDAAKREKAIERRVHYWTRNADAIIVGHALDGIGRWDCAPGNICCIDVRAWRAKDRYSEHDGRNGPVRVLHAPNHRGAKGTEFLLQAVEQLNREGDRVELVLLEKVQNEQVRETMQTVDILADQFILPGYGMAAIEALATGLPVMANLDNEHYTRLFRRYSYFDECPVVSTTPETLTATLRALVRHPQLRRELGRAGRAYAEKYHSYALAQHLFGAVYRKLLAGEDVDLANLFHPLKSAYSKGSAKVAHPLVDSRLPANYRC